MKRRLLLLAAVLGGLAAGMALLSGNAPAALGFGCACMALGALAERIES